MGEARGQGTGGETSLSAFGPKNGSGKGLEAMKLWVGNSTPNIQGSLTGSSQTASPRGTQPWMVAGIGLLGKAKPCFGEEGEPRQGNKQWGLAGGSQESILGCWMSSLPVPGLGWGLRGVNH